MTAAVAYAMIGGFTINILHLIEYAKRPKIERPDFKDLLFYVPYFAWPALGGVLAKAYGESGVMLAPIVAFNVGLSAPLIIRAMAEANPFRPSAINPGEGA